MSGPTNEQQRLDVLTKIRAACDSDALPYEVYCAVAELIEAGRELQAGMDENDNRPMDAGPAKRFLAADARHRAALANVGSQP